MVAPPNPDEHGPLRAVGPRGAVTVIRLVVLLALLPAIAGAETVSFSPGEGVSINSSDDRFAMRLRLRMQARAELRDEGEPELSAQLRRLRIVLEGHAHGIRNRYYLQLGLSPRDQLGALAVDDGSVRRTVVRDARIERRQHRDLELVIGQTKVPFSRQRLASSGELQLPDRALANEEFNLDRDVGMIARSRNLLGRGIGYAVGVFTGRGRNSFEAQPVDLLYVARIELGSEADEVDLERRSRLGLQVGAAYAFQDDAIADRGVFGDRFADGGSSDYHHATLDGQLKYRGLATQVAFHLRYGSDRRHGLIDPGGALPISPRSGLGGTAQLGMLLPNRPIEWTVRYAFVTPLGDSSLQARAELGGGLTWYLAGHGYKVQVAYTRLVERAEGESWLRELRGGQDLAQLQLQLAL